MVGIMNYFENVPNNILPKDATTSILQNNNLPAEQEGAFTFHQSLASYKPTPLIHLLNLAEKFKVKNIYVKDESHRFGLNAFKGLGASYAIHRALAKDASIKVFCTATDGNHGRAVAWSAQQNGKSSVVFVPKDTTVKRIKAIEKEGAKVIQINDNYDDACQQAEDLSKANQWTLIQDTAWEGYIETPAFIMAGYLTMFKELEETLHASPNPKIDLVFLQAGVGSMAAAGVFYYLNRYGADRPKIVIVEPAEADGILQSFKENKITTSKGNSTTIMAGLNCETPSLGAWNLLKNGTDYTIKINDDYAKQAIRTLYYPTGTDERIISGESGAAGLAGFLAILNEPEFNEIKTSLCIDEHTNILFISTEGDTDQAVFGQIIGDKNYK